MLWSCPLRTSAALPATASHSPGGVGLVAVGSKAVAGAMPERDPAGPAPRAPPGAASRNCAVSGPVWRVGVQRQHLPARDPAFEVARLRPPVHVRPERVVALAVRRPVVVARRRPHPPEQSAVDARHVVAELLRGSRCHDVAEIEDPRRPVRGDPRGPLAGLLAPARHRRPPPTAARGRPARPLRHDRGAGRIRAPRRSRSPPRSARRRARGAVGEHDAIRATLATSPDSNLSRGPGSLPTGRGLTPGSGAGACSDVLRPVLVHEP